MHFSVKPAASQAGTNSECQAPLDKPRPAADAAAPALAAADLLAAAAWLKEHQESLPPAVVRLMQAGLTCATGLASPTLKLHQLVLQLRRALGITPSSERQGSKSGRPLDGAPGCGGRQRMTEKERLEHEYMRLGKLWEWHRALARKRRALQKKVGKRLTTLESLDLEDEVPLTPEEEALEAAELAREKEEFDARLAQGQRCDLDCAATAETLMVGCSVAERREDVDCTVSPDDLPRDAVVLKRLTETRERVDIKLQVSTLDISVEKVLVQTGQGQKFISASIDEIGPPRRRVTWNFLVNLAMLSAGQCIPFNRFALLASSSQKRFTAGEIGRYFGYTAERFLPVYGVLGRALANADVLCGDDTPTRVLEVARALAPEAKDAPVPWTSFATQAQAMVTAEQNPAPGLSVQLAQMFGFAFPRKSDNECKRGFNTTVLSGRQDGHDPRSAIIFYRSHLGSLGNLLDVVLSRRDPAKPDLVIQSDLSTTNLISDPDLTSRLNLILAGCASHARRPFALYADSDPEVCDWILHAFKGLAIYEQCLSFHGRNHDNTLAVRGVDGLQLWEDIQRSCEILVKRWSSKTPLGEGARYVLRHFGRLTHYLTDARLAPSNNFPERMLRMERLIQNNALFRQTLNGRFALDILRTVLQTAIAARVDPQAYLLWVLRMPPDVVANEPEQFTPLAFARCCS